MKTTLTARGKQVKVEDFDLPQGDSAPAKRLRATVDAVNVERPHTFGAADGPRPALTVADIQQDLDTARQKLAEEAAWRAELAELLKQVQ